MQKDMDCVNDYVKNSKPYISNANNWLCSSKEIVMKRYGHNDTPDYFAVAADPRIQNAIEYWVLF